MTAPSPSADLLAAAQQGDRAALDAVLGLIFDDVYVVCVRMCGSDGDDACQATLMKIATKLTTFEGDSSFTTWCHRIAVNASLDELRRRSRRAVPVDWDDPDSAHHTDTIDSRASDPTAGVADAVDIDAVLQQLPVDFRIPVVLRDGYGLDYAEIGKLLRLPDGTVRSRISRGRKLAAALMAPPIEAETRGPGNQTDVCERPSGTDE